MELKNIATKDALNCRSLHGVPGQVGFAITPFQGRVTAFSTVYELPSARSSTMSSGPEGAAGTISVSVFSSVTLSAAA